jgi:predicted transcriptional regulator
VVRLPNKTFGELVEFTPCYDHLIHEFDLETAAVYGRIKRYSNMSDGKCWASLDTIAAELNLGRDTIRRRAQLLASAGYLVKEERPGMSSVYHISPPRGRDI